MSTIRNRFMKLASVALLGSAALAAGLPGAVWAQAPASDAAPTEGEVRKVDMENKKITLRHGAIKNLDMPPMTMVFQVSDPALLDKVKAGDKVSFTATGEGGKYTLTGIEPLR